MIPHELASHLILAHRVLVTGPRLTAADLSSLAAIAARIRHTAPVLTVATPLDLARVAGTRRWDSAAYVRAKSESLAETDALVLAPHWEDDVHALASVEIADALGVTIVEWDGFLVPVLTEESVRTLAEVSAAS